jgi:hypothetical protein
MSKFLRHVRRNKGHLCRAQYEAMGWCDPGVEIADAALFDEDGSDESGSEMHISTGGGSGKGHDDGSVNGHEGFAEHGSLSGRFEGSGASDWGLMETSGAQKPPSSFMGSEGERQERSGLSDFYFQGDKSEGAGGTERGRSPDRCPDTLDLGVLLPCPLDEYKEAVEASLKAQVPRDCDCNVSLYPVMKHVAAALVSVYFILMVYAIMKGIVLCPLFYESSSGTVSSSTGRRRTRSFTLSRMQLRLFLT